MSQQPDFDATAGLRLMISQMQQTVGAGLYLAALILALTLPDICGALGSENGRASASKTRRWLEEWLPTDPHRASAIYGLRCSLLHQGSPHPDDGSPRVIFIDADAPDIAIHNIIVRTNEQDGYFLHVPYFVADVSAAVERWLAAHGQASIVQRNLLRFAHRRHDGLSPFIQGVPVIA